MTEVAWLVEIFVSGSHRWWAGYPRYKAESWTTDPLLAVRFSRKQDADAVIHGLFPSWHAVATEHQWGFGE